MLASFELLARLYERFGLHINCRGDGHEVRLVAFEEAKQCGEQRRIPCSRPQFVSPDSGQVEEPLRPTLIAERCRQSGERKNQGITVV